MNKQILISRLNQLHRIRLGCLNTPLDPLARFSKALGGHEIWVKGDVLAGFVIGRKKAINFNVVPGDVFKQRPNLA